MRDAIVFNGASNLDFQEIRTNVIRIPEVVSRIREAQSIWDDLSSTPLDLANFVASEDSVFLGNIRLKSFATAVVQVGLLDRYLRNHSLGEFIVGAVNGDSPLKVALGEQTFFEMVSESAALTGHSVRTGLTALVGGELPILAGMQLAEFAVYRRTDQSYHRLEVSGREVDKMLIEIVDQYEVRKIVMVGPGNTLFGKKALDISDRDVQLLESIDLDPMLSWFWSRLRENRLAIAN